MATRKKLPPGIREKRNGDGTVSYAAQVQVRFKGKKVRTQRTFATPEEAVAWSVSCVRKPPTRPSAPMSPRSRSRT